MDQGVFNSGMAAYLGQPITKAEWQGMSRDEFIKQERLRSEEPRRQATPPQSALDIQVGGSHYKDLVIQPVEFIHRNGIPFIEGNCIKYLCRWRTKGGVADLEKVKHYIDLLIEMESRK